MTKNICLNCKTQIRATPENPEHHTKEEMEKCGRELLSRMVKQMAVVAIFAFLFASVGYANAQEWTESHLFVGVTGINQHEVVISQTQPSLTSVLAGSPIYFTVRMGEPETVSTIGLEQVVSQVEPNKIYGGYDIKTSAITNSQNQTAIIAFVNSEGHTTYSLVIQPEQKQIVTPEIQNSSLLPTWIGNYASYIVGAIIVGVMLAIGISIVKHKNRQNSRWRIN